MAFLYPDPNRNFFSKKTLMFLEKDMANYIARSGAMILPIPDLPKKDLKPYLEEVDGFIFQGGTDVSPLSYKDKHIDKSKWPGDRYRDQFELYIMKYAFKKKKPILGICRGCQLVNVFFGGSLYQDIETEKPSATVHRAVAMYDTNVHDVEIKGKSYLNNIYQEKFYKVISIHHQAIKTLAPDLRAIAHSRDDRLIEAVCFKNMRDQYVMGIQWHPEFSTTMPDLVPDPEPLLQDFLKRCS